MYNARKNLKIRAHLTRFPFFMRFEMRKLLIINTIPLTKRLILLFSLAMFPFRLYAQ